MRALLISTRDGRPVVSGPHTPFTSRGLKADVVVLLCNPEEVIPLELSMFRETLSHSAIGKVLTLEDLMSKAIESFEPDVRRWIVERLLTPKGNA